MPVPTTRPAASRPVPRSPAEFEAWYRQQLGALAPKDVDGFYRLAVTCWANKRPDLAGEVAKRILADWPEHARAKALLRLANQQMAATRPAGSSVAALRASATTAADSGAAATQGPTGQAVVGTANATPPRVLTAEAINRLRLEEFAFRDMEDRPRVVIPRAVIQEFLAEVDKNRLMTDEEKLQFLKSDNDDKLRWILLHTGMRFADRIQVTSEPRSLVTFRQKIWPIVSRTCATPACHGGGNGSGLRYVLPATIPQAGATNFYIASTFEGEDGPLVNREQPEASLLLQYGLPADQAELKHPEPIRPLFVGPADPRYRVVLEWIESLVAPRPQYEFPAQMWQPVGTAGAVRATATVPATTQPIRPAGRSGGMANGNSQG